MHFFDGFTIIPATTDFKYIVFTISLRQTYILYIWKLRLNFPLWIA